MFIGLLFEKSVASTNARSLCRAQVYYYLQHFAMVQQIIAKRFAKLMYFW